MKCTAILFCIIALCSCTSSRGYNFLTGEFIPLTGTPMAEGVYQADTITVTHSPGRLAIQGGSVRIDYDLAAGTADVYREGQDSPVISGFFSEADIKGVRVTSTALLRSADAVYLEEITNGFGSGVRVSVRNAGDGFNMWQHFYTYQTQRYIFIETVVEAAAGVTTNYIAPIAAGTGGTTGVVSLGSDADDPRFLFVPYDNDAFIRFRSDRFMGASESYEVTAIFDNTSRRGMVTGSVTHDSWKTGIRVKTGFARGSETTPLTDFRVFGGIATNTTRDTQPHGSITGWQVHSPLIFLGFYNDWREGMEEYGRANAIIVPPLPWDDGVVFGWNSWSAVADKVNFEVYANASDYLKNDLPTFRNHNGTSYVIFDSFWTNLSVQQRMEAAAYAKANGQRPGIYHSPFVAWHDTVDWLRSSRPEEGDASRWTWFDLVLKDNRGRPIRSTTGMGWVLDPTHPGTVALNNYRLQQFIDWGFEYVKLDFLSHGAVEGVFHNRRITTGKQAYNYGMQQMLDYLGDRIDNQTFFLSLSIAPIFPHQYAHSRRISCDIFGSISNAEYMLNSLTYGWWQHGTIYTFNDPDHIIIWNSYNHPDPHHFNEGLTRYISSSIAGTLMIISDDFRIPEARERGRQIYNNDHVNRMASDSVSFRPVEGNTGDRSTDVFVRHDADGMMYVAVFNFTMTPVTREVSLERIGLNPLQTYQVFNMITHEYEAPVTTGFITLNLDMAEPALLRLH